MTEKEIHSSNPNVGNLKKLFENSNSQSKSSKKSVDSNKAEVKQTSPLVYELGSLIINDKCIEETITPYMGDVYYSIDKSKVIQLPNAISAPVLNNNFFKSEQAVHTVELIKSNNVELYETNNFPNINSISIEPSPIRTLSNKSLKTDRLDASFANWLNDTVPVIMNRFSDSHNNYANLDTNKSVPNTRANLKESSSEIRNGIQNENIQKLNEFFGESKTTVTALENKVFTSIFKTGSTEDILSFDINENIPSKNKENKASNNKKDLTSWHNKLLKTLKKHMHGINSLKLDNTSTVKRSTFGVSLEDCPLSNTQKVPLLVEFCVNVVDTIGLQIQGIYRIPGNSASVNELVNELSKDADSINYESERWLDAHVVGSLLKLFFRKLPDALFTDKSYGLFIQCIKKTEWEKKISELKFLIKNLPSLNYLTLRYLIYHLRRVSLNQHFNKMDIHNLAIMFGPTLVHPKDETMAHMILDMNNQTEIVAILIKYCDWIFNDLPESQNIPKEQFEMHSTSSTTNLQLLSNAESLLALKMKSTSPETPPDNAGPFAFLRSGIKRRSNRRRRNKSDRDAASDDEGCEVVNSDFTLLAVNPENGKTSSDSNKKCDPFISELKRTTAQHLSASCDDLNKNIRRSRVLYDEQPPSININKDKVSNESAPFIDIEKTKNRSDSINAKEESLVKRYPAYNFYDSTIGTNKKASRKKSDLSSCDFGMPANSTLNKDRK